MKIKNFLRYSTFLLLVVMLLHGCDLLDCTNYPVQNLNVAFYDSEGSETVLADTLNVKACGTDSILVNKDVYADDMLLPLSYKADEDTFLLDHRGEDYQELDTLFVRKTNDQFFESPDCPTRMIHTLLEVRSTHEFIDSVKIVNAQVGFYENVNLKVYLKP